MSEFKVPVVEVLDVQPHPNADRLDLVSVLGYTCITEKGRFKQGDRAVYVPENAIVPDSVLQSEGFWDHEKNRGVLSGSKYNRVKALKLRGIFSQGLLFNPGATNSNVGEDTSTDYGITKYEPEIPVHMAGEVTSLFGHTLKFDIESIQSQPDVFDPDDIVVVTEKLHGTNFQAGRIPGLQHPDLLYDGSVYVTSKGMGAKGLVLKNNEKNAGNLYLRATPQSFHRLTEIQETVHILGEVVGKGVQDLDYGLVKPRMYVFEVRIDGEALTYGEMSSFCEQYELPMVPLLARARFEYLDLLGFRDGQSVIPTANHLREGIVITTNDGKKRAKFVSPDYLLRKNGTEFQ